MNEQCFVTSGEAAKYLGVSYSTIRRWDKERKLQCKRLPSGHRIVDISAYKEKTCEKNETNRITILYSRVSSHKQKDDAERQKKYLEDKIRGTTKDFIHIQDIASGLNFKRKGLFRILDAVKEGKVQRVVVASKDRLARFGFDLIQWICNEYDTEILVLDDDNQTPTEELGKDLLSIVQIYCCKWNGKRRYKCNNKDSEASIVSNEGTETET